MPAELEPTKAGLSQFVGAVAAAFPDIQFTVEDLLAEGDRVAFRGSYRRDILEGLPTGLPRVADRLAERSGDRASSGSTWHRQLGGERT